MKVIMLAPAEGCGGIAAYSRDLIDAVAEHADVSVEPLTPGAQSKGFWQTRTARLNSADVVHIQHEHSLFGGILPGRSTFWTLRYLIEKPVVITAHNTAPALDLAKSGAFGAMDRLRLTLLLRRRAYRDSIDAAPFVSGRCITVSRADRQALVARGAQARYVHAIPAGTRPPTSAVADDQGFRERYGLKGRRVVLQSMLGSAHATTLQILDELPPDAVVVHIRTARDREVKPGSVAHLLPHRRAALIEGLAEDDLPAALAAAEVVLAGGDTAGGPRDVLQAMAFGKPVLAPDFPAFREIQERVPCLRLVRSGDAGHLAACLKAVLANDLGRAEMAERGRRYAERFDWKWVAEKTMEVYDLTIADDRSPIRH